MRQVEIDDGEEIFVQIAERRQSAAAGKCKAVLPWILELQEAVWTAVNFETAAPLTSPIIPSFEYPHDDLFTHFANQSQYLWSLHTETLVRDWVLWAAAEVHRIACTRWFLLEHRSADTMQRLLGKYCARGTQPLSTRTARHSAALTDDISRAATIAADALVTETLTQLTSSIGGLIKQWTRLCPQDSTVDYGQWYLKEGLQVRAYRLQLRIHYAH